MLDSLFFNKPCTPSPIKPKIRSVEDKVGSVDTISVLFVASSICLVSGLSVALSEEYEESASNTIGGMNTIPIPIQSITTDMIEVIAMIVTLSTCY